MSGEAFSTYLIVHVNSLYKIFIIFNSKIILHILIIFLLNIIIILQRNK